MKLYRINGNVKQDIGRTAEHYAHELASGLSSRGAADRVVEALATQGAWSMTIESYVEEESADK